MMKRTLSFLLCLIMIVSLAAPSVQASGSDNAYASDDIMDNIVIEDGANVEIVTDGNTVSTTQETRLPNPMDLMTEPETLPQIPVVTAPVEPVVEVCECVDLASAKVHGGICKAKTPYIEVCKLSEQELFALWNSYTAVEQSFLLSHLEEQYPLKHFNLEKLLSAPTGSASETYVDGTTVSVEGIPQDGSLTVDKAADAVKDIVDDYVAEQEQEATPLFGYDVSVQDGEGADWQPNVNVKMELELPGEKLHKNTKVFVVHVDDNGVATTIEAAVTEDGKITFETPGFSAFFGFTVDFEYDGVQFSIKGLSSIKLSELIDKLGMPLNAEDVTNVAFTNDEYIRIEKLEGDWELFSLKEFSTTETLTLTMNDGQVYEIIVTDAQYAKVWCDSVTDGLGMYEKNWDADADGNCNGIVTWQVASGGKGDATKSKGYSRTQPIEIEGPGTMIIKIENELNKLTSAAVYLDLFQITITGGADVTIMVNETNGTYQSKNKIVGLTSCAYDSAVGKDGYCMIWVANGSLTLQGSENIDLLIGGDYNKGHGSRDERSDKYGSWPLVMLAGNAKSLTVKKTQFIHAAAGAIGSYSREVPSSVSIHLEDCYFHKSIYNTKSLIGGAVQHYQTGNGGTFYAKNCTFNGNNSTADSGGAIGVAAGITSFTLEGCTFTNCTSPTDKDGGMIIVRSGGQDLTTFSMSGCTFTGTAGTLTCGNRGGAISIEKNVTNLTLTNCQFSNISAPNHGGVICLSKAEATQGDLESAKISIGAVSLTGCSFTNCSAAGRGAAIRAVSSAATNVTINDCDFTSCAATTHGGAVAWQGVVGNITVNNGSTFTSCTANNNGGAISVECTSAGNVEVNGSTLSNNTSVAHGGAIAFKSPIIGTIKLIGSTFSGNAASRAGSAGGAVYFGMENTQAIAAQDVTVSGCTFRDNRAHGLGGGICLTDGKYKSISVTDSTFDNCDTTGYGGALGFKKCIDSSKISYIIEENLTILGCTFTNCLSGNLAPAAYLNTETNEGVKQWDHDGDPNTDPIDQLNGASGAGAIIIGGSIGGVLEIKGKSKTEKALFQNCVTWNSGGAIFFTDDLAVAGKKDATTGKYTEGITIQYVTFDKCFARDAGSAVYFSSSTIPRLDMKNCMVQFCGYFDANDPNFDNPDATVVDAASLLEFTEEWFTTQTIYDVTGYDADGKPILVKNQSKTDATKTEQLARWLDYDPEDLYPGTDYSGTFRTVGGTACVAYITESEFRYNRSYSNGGGVYWNANRIVYQEDDPTEPEFITALTITNSYLHHNYAGGVGGGLFCEGSATIESCEIYNNTAGLRGGGIAQNVYNNSSRQLGESGDDEGTSLVLKAATGGEPVKIYNNTSLDGGGISITVAMSDSYPHTVKPGTANADINKPANWIFRTDFTYNVRFQLGGTHVYNNKATRNGGGIFYDTTYYKGMTGEPSDGVSWDERQRQVDSFVKDILIDDGLIYSNTSGYGATADNGGTGNGGGVYMNSNQINTKDTISEGELTGSSTVTITGGSVYDNHATMGNGGGIYLRGKNAVCSITGGVIGATANKVTVNGVVTMTPNESKPNTATGYVKADKTTVGGNGGGIAVFAGVRLEMAGGYIVNNSCSIAGGGIAVHEASSMLFTKGTVKNNSANMGGGISLNGAKPLNENSELDAEKYAMFMDGGIIQENRVYPITYTSNVYGGGVCISAKSTMKISKGEISGNTAAKTVAGTEFGQNQEGGGVAVCEQSKMFFDGGKIHDNKAYRGGGILIRGTSEATMNGQVQVDDEDKVISHDGSIYNNYAQYHGGGVFVYAGTSTAYNKFTMDGGYIWNNEAYYNLETGEGTGSGGAVYLRQYARFTLNGGRIEGNRAANGGGAVCADQNSTTTVYGGVVKGNITKYYGGAVYLLANAQFTLENGRVETNSGYDGGAIYLKGGASATITGGSLKGNSSSRYGGAIYNNNSNLLVQNGEFDGNSAAGKGGAIFNYGTDEAPYDLDITGGTFTNNIAKSNEGGAICCGGDTEDVNVGDVSISSGTFTGNAGKLGGGLTVNRCTVAITGGIFQGNVSNRGGGLFIRSCPSVTISNIQVLNNKCKADNRIDAVAVSSQLGGGLYIDSETGPCNVEINTGIFTGNEAPRGGGIMIYNSTDVTENNVVLTINGGTIESNKALSGDGGGVFVSGGGYVSDTHKTSLTMNGGIIRKNTASGNGGGIYATAKGVVLITTGTQNNQATHGEITQNTADNGGGVYVTSGADLSVIGGYITYNNATAPSTATLPETGRLQKANLHGAGGGICVTTGEKTDEKTDPSTFTLDAPQGTNNMAIYGNEATFSADDVFSSGYYTQLTVPTVQGMNMEGYGFAPEGWFEDYNTNDTKYDKGLNMRAHYQRSVPVLRYRNAVGNQRLLIEPLYVLGKLDNQTVSGAYVNKANAYVAMTLGMPAAVDDTVVIDYAGPVNINLFENDLILKAVEFTDTGSYLMNTLPTPSEKNGVINKNYVYYSEGASPVGTHSTDLTNRAIANVWKGGLKYNADGTLLSDTRGIVTYAPSYSELDFTEDTFGYTVKHNQYWYYAKVTVVSATTLYFEDHVDYITYHTTSKNETLATWIPVNSVGQTSAGTDVGDPLQGQDRPGFTDLSSLDAENIYGYDSTRKETATFSNGSAHKVTVSRHKATDEKNFNNYCDAYDNSKGNYCRMKVTHTYQNNGSGKCSICLNTEDKHDIKTSHKCTDGNNNNEYCDVCSRWIGMHTTSARATFTFTGTGFDVVSLCNKDTGIVMVSVYKGIVEDFDNPPVLDKNRYVASYVVDTHYGYRYDEESGKWIVDENSTDSLYQVPVIKADLTKVMTKMDDPNTEEDEAEYKDWGYGTYSVEIYVANSFLEREPGYWNADFYLDSIRIYNPAGVGDNVNGTALEAYQKDNEAWPSYVEVRNLLIDQAVLDDEANDGVIFIDGKDENVTLKDYTSWGPNNEVYLHPGEHIAFTMNMANYGQDVKSIHMAMRGLTGQSSVLVQAGTGTGSKVGVLNKTLSTTDLYYDISKDANGASVAGKVITISNAGTKPIAISTIKVTHGTKPVKDNTIGGLIQSSMMTGYIALQMLSTDPAGNPVVTPKYPALSYNGMICYNVFFSAEDLGDLTADDLGLAVFDSYDPQGTVETAKDVIMGATEIDGIYMVATNGVHAKYLSDTQYFRAFAKQADGSYAYSKMVSYSALDYATNVLAKSDDVKLKQLVVAMLNYGAEAQKFFGYKTDNLMNKDLTADHQALLSGFDANSLNGVQKADPAKLGAFASTGGFTSKYPAISFKGAFEINYFFTPANVVDGDMTLYFWNEDTYNSVTELTAENADKAVAMTLENGAYTASSDEIFARQLDKTLYAAAVYESNGVTYCSGVLPYSIAAYCQKPPADVQALATAAAIYGCTAKQFFGE